MFAPQAERARHRRFRDEMQRRGLTFRCLPDATQLDPLLIVAGSLYLIGEVLELLGEDSGAGERALNEWSARPR